MFVSKKKVSLLVLAELHPLVTLGRCAGRKGGLGGSEGDRGED